MAQQHTPAAGSGQLPGLEKPHQRRSSTRHGLRVFVAAPHGCALALLLASLLVCSAGRLYAAPVAGAGALFQPVPIGQAGASAVGVGSAGLSQSPRPDWLTSLVEFLSAVPPKCGAVPNPKPNEKCEHRNGGVLEEFRERHPVAFNLLVAAFTLLAGFIVGGGLQGGK